MPNYPSLNGQISSDILDVQGHRGWKGKFPENSIIGFIEAAKRGVTTLEMDVVIAKDGTVIVSHEPWISSSICLDISGDPIPKNKEKSFNIYQMTYEEIKEFDCGSKPLASYPDQKKLVTHKPSLTEVIEAIEKLFEEKEKKIQYNIEIKSHEKGDHIFHPPPSEFVDLVLSVIKNHNVFSRTIIQSFDVRILKKIHQIYDDALLALLVGNYSDPLTEINKLGFQPDIFSPNHIFLVNSHIRMLQEKNIKVIPWTVNKREKMQKLIDLHVDGIITDFPGKLLTLLENQ